MPRTSLTATVLACVGTFGLATTAYSASFTLDFESAATGGDLLTGSLSSPLGTISLFQETPGDAYIGTTAFGGFPDDLPVATFGARLVEAGTSGDIGLDFGFDVLSLTFNIGGDGGGFAASVLDSGGTVLDAFSVLDLPASGAAPGPITLSSSSAPIRFLRFEDSLAGAAVDNVVITTPSAVPVPAALPLLGAALLGLGIVRRSRRAT